MLAMPADESSTTPSKTRTAGGLLACPCCCQQTLEERANFEICPECGWEDDGQDDEDAHIVRGGPNGRLSLTQARLDYLEAEAGESDGVVGDARWAGRVAVRSPPPRSRPD
ncbi:CPCC family cysteine-rich protein [Streptomyces sp. NPDC001514]